MKIIKLIELKMRTRFYQDGPAISKPLRIRSKSIKLTRFTGAVSRQGTRADNVTLIITGYQLKSSRTHLHTPAHLTCKLW